VKYLTRIAFALGLAVLIVLVIREGAQSIAGLLKQAGWPLLLLIPLHIAPLLLDVMGWRVLILEHTRVASLFSIAAIREAINRLLPVANVGGELVGIRLLARQGVSGTTAASSVVIEMLLNVAAQYVFLALGLLFLLRITGSVRPTVAIFLAIAAPIPLFVCLLWLLKSGRLLKAAEKLGASMLAANPERFGAMGRLAQFDTAIRRLVSAHYVLAQAVVWQLAGLIVGCSETWLALRLLGHPLSLAAAIALESVTQAARSLIFVAPAGLGVQEASLIGVGQLLGLGSDVAIALSLAKRMREILFGLPALLVWQVTSRFLRNPAHS
jgi:putative membrane protein